jgi:hypothetical protein
LTGKIDFAENWVHLRKSFRQLLNLHTKAATYKSSRWLTEKLLARLKIIAGI